MEHISNANLLKGFCVFEDILEHYFVQLKKYCYTIQPLKGTMLLSIILHCSLTSSNMLSVLYFFYIVDVFLILFLLARCHMYICLL